MPKLLRRFAKALPLFLALPLLLAWGGGTPARRDVHTFILESLRKQQGEAWELTGQFLIWSYGFDRSGCLLTVQREAELGDLFQQRIPMAEATVVGSQGSELVFDCRRGDGCIDYNIKNRYTTDEQQVVRTRVLVMDAQDIAPLMNAFAELHQLCRDPYAPERRGRGFGPSNPFLSQ